MSFTSKRRRSSGDERSDQTPPRRLANTYSQVDDETESSSKSLQPFPSQDTRDRVDFVVPDGRCLIENVPSVQGVEYAHYFPKHLERKEDMLTCLEYLWGMQYQSLNLDCRFNVFHVGASLLDMFDKDMWMLLPDEDTVRAFEASLDRRRNGWYAHRKDFPVLQEKSFRYYFVPISDAMKEIAISRQNGTSGNLKPQPDSITVHLYPFRTLPQLSSHLHPKFVLLEAGRKIKKLSDLVSSLELACQEAAHAVEILLDGLRARWPMIEQVEHIYEAWMRPPNIPHMLADSSFTLPRAQRSIDPNDDDELGSIRARKVR